MYFSVHFLSVKLLFVDFKGLLRLKTNQIIIACQLEPGVIGLSISAETCCMWWLAHGKSYWASAAVIQANANTPPPPCSGHTNTFLARHLLYLEQKVLKTCFTDSVLATETCFIHTLYNQLEHRRTASLTEFHPNIFFFFFWFWGGGKKLEQQAKE